MDLDIDNLITILQNACQRYLKKTKHRFHFFSKELGIRRAESILKLTNIIPSSEGEIWLTIIFAFFASSSSTLKNQICEQLLTGQCSANNDNHRINSTLSSTVFSTNCINAMITHRPYFKAAIIFGTDTGVATLTGISNFEKQLAITSYFNYKKLTPEWQNNIKNMLIIIEKGAGTIAREKINKILLTHQHNHAGLPTEVINIITDYLPPIYPCGNVIASPT